MRKKKVFQILEKIKIAQCNKTVDNNYCFCPEKVFVIINSNYYTNINDILEICYKKVKSKLITKLLGVIYLLSNIIFSYFKIYDFHHLFF